MAHTGTHTMSRERTGFGMSDSITAACSCGWRGTPRFGYDDWQSTNVRADEVRHLSDLHATSDAMRFAAGMGAAGSLGEVL